MSLAAILLPMIPGVLQWVMGVIRAIESHSETPEEAKAQLADIARRLEDAAARVAAVEV
jgi:hypothetical protein